MRPVTKPRHPKWTRVMNMIQIDISSSKRCKLTVLAYASSLDNVVDEIHFFRQNTIVQLKVIYVITQRKRKVSNWLLMLRLFMYMIRLLKLLHVPRLHVISWLRYNQHTGGRERSVLTYTPGAGSVQFSSEGSWQTTRPTHSLVWINRHTHIPQLSTCTSQNLHGMRESRFP